MATRRVRFSFEPELIKEPVIYQLGHKFQVVTNIRMADVDERIGWVVLELEGEPDEIERSIRWAQEQGVRVDDPVLAEQIEKLFVLHTDRKHAWRLSLEGGQLRWSDGDQTYKNDPLATRWQRFQAWITRVLHLDAQL